MRNVNFGEHLTLDCYGGDKVKLNSERGIKAFLEKIVREIGMKKLSPVQVYYTKGNGLKDTGGYSGFVVINESHISIHTFPGKRFASADIYTCQNGLKKAFIKSLFKEAFDFKKFETNFIKRGLEFPYEDIA